MSQIIKRGAVSIVYFTVELERRYKLLLLVRRKVETSLSFSLPTNIVGSFTNQSGGKFFDVFTYQSEVKGQELVRLSGMESE